MEKRLRSFADAGVTDLNCRIVPLGEGRDADQGVGRAHPGVPGGGRAVAYAPSAEDPVVPLGTTER